MAAKPQLRIRSTALALAAAALGTLALAAPALADTTIGQTGGSANIRCASPGVEADTSYVVPSGGGTITSFSFQSVAANAGVQLDFLVLQATGGIDYTVVGKTGPVTLAGTGAVETFAANIPVQGGEILGFWNPGLTACVRFVGSGGGVIGTQAPLAVDPSVGDALSLPAAIPAFSLNESANLVPTCQGQAATIVAVPGQPTTGTDGDDVIVGTHKADEIRAGAGDDLVCALGGADQVGLGQGADFILAGGGADLVRAKGGSDAGHLNNGDDELHGGKGNDSFRGDQGDDSLFGRAGADNLNGKAGENTLDGGNGSDRCVNGPVLIDCERG